MVYLAYEVSDSGTNLELTEYPLVLVRNPSKGNTMNLVDNLNKTANEESESETLQNATQLSEPASTPLGGQMQGEGTDAAKMQGTPLAKKGGTNERLDAAAQQEQQRVDPQAMTVDQYQRTQNVQDQTLGKAQEEAKAWSDKMASAGSNANNVSKLIMDQTQANMDKAENETYAKEIFSDDDTLNSISTNLGVASTELEGASAEIGEVMKSLGEGNQPTNEQLEALRAKLPEGTDFSKVVGELEKALNNIDVGEKLASDSINAEDVTLSKLMDEGLVEEETVRLFLGLADDAPLPEGWEDQTMAELNRAGAEDAARQAEDLRIQQQKAGLKADAGADLENITDMQEAEEEQADSVQFGDKRMSVEDFLDDDRIKREMNDIVLDEELMSAEGEELDAILKEKFGDQFDANPDYYRDLVSVGKANKEQITASLDTAKATQEGIEETQGILDSLMTNTGLTADMFSEMTGLDFSTWDMSAGDLQKSQDILKEYGGDLARAFKLDPDFFATLKKEDGQSWDEFAQEINDKLGAIGVRGDSTANNFDRAQQINKNFDESGKFIGKDVDGFMKEMFNMDNAQLKTFIDQAALDPEAQAILDSLPDYMKDGSITPEELSENFSQGGGIDLDALQSLDLVAQFDSNKKDLKSRDLQTVLGGLVNKSPKEQKAYFDKYIDKMSDDQKRSLLSDPTFSSSNMAYDYYDKMPKDVQAKIKKEASAAINQQINSAKPSGAGPEFANNLIDQLNDPNSLLAKQAKLGNTSWTRLFYHVGGQDDKIGKGETKTLNNLVKAMESAGVDPNDKAFRSAKYAADAVSKGKVIKYMGHNIVDKIDGLESSKNTQDKAYNDYVKNFKPSLFNPKAKAKSREEYDKDLTQQSIIKNFNW